VDDWRLKRWMPNRGSAVRELLKRGMAAEGFGSTKDRAKSGHLNGPESLLKKEGGARTVDNAPQKPRTPNRLNVIMCPSVCRLPPAKFKNLGQHKPIRGTLRLQSHDCYGYCSLCEQGTDDEGVRGDRCRD
jgi:hypothetical protein